jgi:hypothetical protein
MRAIVLVLAALPLAACAAAGNPEASELEPLQRTPPAPAEAKPEAATTTPANAQQPNTPPSAQGDATPAPADLSRVAIGRVGDRPIPASEYLRRLWIDNRNGAMKVLEQMLFAQVTELEADRLGIRLVDGAVEAAYQQSVKRLEDRLAEDKKGLTLDQYAERTLKVDPKVYRATLRDETIIQLLAERCVRAWLLESDRRKVRLSEIRDPAELEAARKDLAAGKGFEEIALAHGLGDDETSKTTRMTIARAENNELAKLVFATPIGTVGGPFEQSGRWLFFVADEELAGREGGWPELRTEVEQGIDGEPVSNLEFLQWRAAMERRYPVDVSPFSAAVEGRKP